MRKIIPFLIVSAFIIPAFYFSFQKNDDPNRYASYTARLILPFDTAMVLEMMKIADSVNAVSKYLYEEPYAHFSALKIDTIDMRDLRWACDCPNWRYADSTRQDFSGGNDFYIEPADETLRLPEHLMNPRVQFIGREYPGPGYPKNPEFMDPNPPKGRVFRYYAYKIYKPFTVYGPEENTEVDEGIYPLTELTIKKIPGKK
ncbi:MAG: hypothetical protein ABIQ40_03505 [Bacteroidia bacterium]